MTKKQLHDQIELRNKLIERDNNRDAINRVMELLKSTRHKAKHNYFGQAMVAVSELYELI